MTPIAPVRPAVHVVHAPRLRARRVRLEPALADLGWSPQWVIAPEGGLLARLRCGAHPRLSRGQVEVYLKHRALLGRMAGEGGWQLVLEDDAIFPEGFATRFARACENLPSDADVVFFGASCGLELEPEPAHPGYARACTTRSMSGYLIRPAAAGVLAAALARAPMRRPVDLTINALLRSTPLAVYWSVPALIQNGSETGHFPSATGGGFLRSRAAAMKRRLLGPAR